MPYTTTRPDQFSDPQGELVNPQQVYEPTHRFEDPIKITNVHRIEF